MGATGPTGETGASGADSTVTGPTGASGTAGIGLSPVVYVDGGNVSTTLTPGTYTFTDTIFATYRTPNNPWAAGQYITIADNTSGSTLVYFGT